MDKKSTRIIIGCVLCTMIVLMLFLIVLKFSQLSCELVSLEPIQLRSAQLAAFSKDKKPVRSHDKTILMKISAYLEYNIQQDSNEKSHSNSNSWPSPSNSKGSQMVPSSFSESQASTRSNGVMQTTANNLPMQLANAAGVSNNNNVLAGNLTTNMASMNLSSASSSSISTGTNNQIGASGSNSTMLGRQQQGPNPSMPIVGFNQQQLQNSSFLSTSLPNKDLTGIQQQQQQQKVDKRFLPLELKSIETRNLEGTKHKYILTFNCTKLNMVLVHQDNRVFVESMDLELKPSSRLKSTCQVQLEPGAFAVESLPSPVPFQKDTAATGLPNVTRVVNSSSRNNKDSNQDYTHFAHYHCNKPLHFNCYHYKSGPNLSNGLLLAELHINAIEFETSTDRSNDDHKHVKSEFKSRRSECNV